MLDKECEKLEISLLYRKTLQQVFLFSMCGFSRAEVENASNGELQMCEKRQLEEFEQEELEQILDATISLTVEATALTKEFNELLDQTTHVSPEVLNIRLR